MGPRFGGKSSEWFSGERESGENEIVNVGFNVGFKPWI